MPDEAHQLVATLLSIMPWQAHHLNAKANAQHARSLEPYKATIKFKCSNHRKTSLVLVSIALLANFLKSVCRLAALRAGRPAALPGRRAKNRLDKTRLGSPAKDLVVPL